MDFLRLECGICGLVIGDVGAHWQWHEVTDAAVIPEDKAGLFANAREQLKQRAEVWAEMDRRQEERRAAQ